MSTWNSGIAKQAILLGSAGDDQYNPYLAGLPLQLQTEFSETVYPVTCLAGSTNPPTTPVTLTVDPDNARRYIHNFVAGQGAFNTIDADTFVKYTFSALATGDATTWEKRLRIASLPADAIQVYDIENGWTSVNFATAPATIPTVSQMCPVRFLNSWFNEFRIKGFGGAQYVSAYDYGSAESGSSKADILRFMDSRIDQVNYIYLAKHMVATEETHDIAVKFKTATGAGAAGVVVRIKVKSVACWGFAIKDPVTT